MLDALSQGWQFLRSVSTGNAAFDIVILIGILLFVLIVFLVLLWILWKLLVLMGKGIAWLFGTGGQKLREKRQAAREARLAGPPAVSTNWGASRRIGLRRALVEARRLGGPDSVVMIILAGDGMEDICRSLGMTPPSTGEMSIAADPNSVLIDASRVDSRGIRRLAGALPWKRPTDAIVAFVDENGVPIETLSRAATFARASGMRVALHLSLPTSSKTAAWQIIEPHRLDGGGICNELSADAARLWLVGGSRQGLKDLVLAQSNALPSSLDRTLSAAPSSIVDVSSLSFGGVGLRAAIGQTLGRTKPSSAPGITMWAAIVVLGLGALTAVLNVIDGFDTAGGFRATVSQAAREAATPWQTEGITTVASPARTRRIAGLSEDLADFSDFSLLRPLAPLIPNHGSSVGLAAAFLDGYVLRPLAESLNLKARDLLVPSDDPERWLEDARIVGEWISAWEALAENPREVDLRRLFTAAFGGSESAWAEGTDIALVKTGVTPPPPNEGGLDIDALSSSANSSFVETVGLWASRIYTNSPAALAAKRAVDRNTNWREQYQALRDLRTALEDPSQRWLTSSKDLPDLGLEARVLGRAVGLSLFGPATALAGKAAIGRIRIRAREDAIDYVLPGVGPVMARSGVGSGLEDGELGFTREADAWLNFLDRIANAGFSDPPIGAATYVSGVITLDVVAVAEARERLRQFDQFAANLPIDVPPLAARKLIEDLGAELTVGIVTNVERAIRPVRLAGVARESAGRLARVEPALGHLVAIEEWLLQRQALAEAERIADTRTRVAADILTVATQVLNQENPLGVQPDPTADGNAIIRRYERGLAAMRQIRDQLAAPFIEPALGSRERSVVEWRDIALDMAAHERGDVGSALSGIEGMLRAFAEDPVEACRAPRPLAAGRDDYVARTLARLRSELEFACRNRVLSDARRAYRRLAEHFERNVADLYPYSSDNAAPEITPETLSAFVSRLEETKDALESFDDDFAFAMLENANFWTVDQEGSAVVRFRIDWRVRPGEEQNAHHIIEYGIRGAQADENGVYTWRFGSPLSITMRLANNSPLRFLDSRESGLIWVYEGEDGGGLLRLLRSVLDGALAIEGQAVDTAAQTNTIVRVTLRMRGADGLPLSLPKFPERVPPNLLRDTRNTVAAGAAP